MNIQRAPVHAIIEGEGVSEEAALDGHLGVLANLKIQLLTTEGSIHLSKSGLSSCFDVAECGDCLLASENHLALLLRT